MGDGAGKAELPSPQAAGGESSATLRQDLKRQFTTATDPVTVAGWTVELLRPRNSDDLISEADFVRDERLPYWADLWPSARVLAAHVLETGARAGPKRPRLLELGCGLGLVAMAALRAGYDVVATDYYADALRFTRANASRAVGREPATRLVDWRSFPADLGRFDCVVAADVLYEREYATLVSAAVARTLLPDGLAIIADPGRVAAPDFLAHLATDGLAVAGAELRPFQEGVIRQTITLYTLRRIADRPVGDH
jgi:predicted nicotinamide N-methyase